MIDAERIESREEPKNVPNNSFNRLVEPVQTFDNINYEFRVPLNYNWLDANGEGNIDTPSQGHYFSLIVGVTI